MIYFSSPFNFTMNTMQRNLRYVILDFFQFGKNPDSI